MIKINLLPADALKKEKRAGVPKLQLPQGDYLAWGKKAAIAILAIHLALLLVFIIEKSYLAGLRAKSDALKPELAKVAGMKSNLMNLESQSRFADDLRSSRTSWSRNLAKISESIPKGMWLRRLAASESNFTLEGSVFCGKCAPMDVVSEFLQALKKDAKFAQIFSELELASVQKKAYGSIDVSEFSISGKVKESAF